MTSMAFADLYPVSTRLEPVAKTDVDRLAAEHGLELPVGYAEFVQRFGPGTVCDYLVVRAPEGGRAWRAAYADSLLCEDLYEGSREEWSALGVTFDQFRGGLSLLDTDQTPDYLSVPGHGPAVFEVIRGDVRALPGGLPEVIGSVVETFGVEFPYFEPARTGRSFASHHLRPGVELDALLAAMEARWGAGVRRLRSSEDDYAVTLFARPVQAKFVCYRESGELQDPPFSFQVNAYWDEEHTAEVNDFLRPFDRG
jgi:hypothetical protein